MAMRCGEARLFGEIFSAYSDLNDWGICCLLSPLECIWNYLILLQLPRWLRWSKPTLITLTHLVLIVFHWQFWRTANMNFQTFQLIFSICVWRDLIFLIGECHLGCLCLTMFEWGSLAKKYHIVSSLSAVSKIFKKACR